MRLNAASIAVLAILGVIAAALKITATVKASRARELPKTLRVIFVLRTAFFFLVVAVGLDNYFLPPMWQYPAVGFKLFLTLVGVWIALLVALPILMWKHRNANAHKQVGVKTQ